MRFEEIIKTRREVEDLGYEIENDVIRSVDVRAIAHFGDVVCLVVWCDNVTPISSYNNTKNLGYVIQAFIKLFDLSKEDGVDLSEIKDVPCRLVFYKGRCVGLGHFMKDRFVFTEDLARCEG